MNRPAESMESQCRKRVLVSLGAIAILFAAVSNAAEYSLQSEIRVSAEHDDNYRLLVDDAESLTGASVIPSLVAEVQEENWSLLLDTELAFRRFDSSELDTDDQNIRLQALRQGERYSVDVTAGVVRDTTRTSEELDSGRVGLAQRHENYSVGAFASYLLTETNQLNASMSAAESKYDTVDRTGYEYYQGQLGWTHAYSSALSFNVAANISRVEYEPVEAIIFLSPLTRTSTTDSYGWTLGTDYAITEKFSLSARYGQSDTETVYELAGAQGICGLLGEGAPGICDISGQNSTVPNWRVNLDRQGERHNFSIGYSNSLQPSSDGVVIESERLSVTWQYRTSERGSLTLEALVGENKALRAQLGDSIARRVDRIYAHGAMRYSYRFNTRWRVFSTVAYRYQDYETVDGDAESARVLLGFAYTPRKSSWSR